MRPNFLEGFTLIFIVLLIFVSNLFYYKENFNSTDDPLFEFDMDEDTSYIDIYSCLNNHDSNELFYNTENSLNINDKNIVPDIFNLCKTQLDTKSTKYLNNLLNFLVVSETNKEIYNNDGYIFYDI